MVAFFCFCFRHGHIVLSKRKVCYYPPVLTLKPQEVPFDSPESDCMFQPSAEKPLLATPEVVRVHTMEELMACLARVQHLAQVHNGADYLQVFKDDESGERVFLIEDGPGGAITFCLPEER